MKTKRKPRQNIRNELKNKTILITGGAGSIGTNLVKRILEYPIKSVRILDVDEHALFTLKRSINDSRLRLLLGSITNKERVEIACNDVDMIIHAAAIKNIEISEYNPIETIDTNTNGTLNIVKAVIKYKIQKFVNISTDKAAEPSTLYGTTKQLGEKITSWAGNVSSSNCATIRFGNVFETRGNVFEVWKQEDEKQLPLSITDPTMRRYFFHVDEAIDFIFECLPYVKKGEIFVPKMESFVMKELANKISKNHKIIGLRPGEKMNEILLTEYEKQNAIEKKSMWIIKPKIL